MKISITASVLILAIGVTLGLIHQKRLKNLCEDQRQLVAQAGKLGISCDPPTSSGDPRIHHRPHENRDNSARAMTAELVALAKEMELQQKGAAEPDEAFQAKMPEMMLRMLALDASQLKLALAGMRDDPSVSEETRRNLIGYSLLILSEEHPAAALALFTESSALLSDSQIGRGVIFSALGRWAKDDPLAALEWLRKNSAAHPDIVDDDAKRSIIAGAAENNPPLAFKLIAEMGLEDRSAALRSLVETGASPDQRTAILDALRDYLTTLPDAADRADLLQESLENMGRNLSEEDFDSVKSWIAASKLSSQETAQFAAGLSYFNTKQDTGRWIDWMAGNLPKDQLAENVENLIGQWTQQDYQAAGKWLSAAAEGPAKNAAVASYAATVAEYEPQTAVQWALTLPAGPQRQQTLESIYQNWPKSDASAAAAFAHEHALDTTPDGEETREEP